MNDDAIEMLPLPVYPRRDDVETRSQAMMTKGKLMKNPSNMKKNGRMPCIVGALAMGALLCSVLAFGEKVAESGAKTFDLNTLARTPPANGTILDFETNDERGRVPTIDNASCRVFVTNGLATSGEHAVAFVCADWRPGMEVWPSFTIDLPIDRTDWRGYDRLAIDVVNFGNGRATSPTPAAGKAPAALHFFS